MRCIALFATLLVYGHVGSHAANILYFNLVPSPSHFVWNRALMYGLAERGHNLTVVSVDVEDNPPPNVTFIYVEDIYEKTNEEMLDDQDGGFLHMGQMNVFEINSVFSSFVLFGCDAILKTEGAKRILNYPQDFPVDVIINDFMMGPCLASLAHHRFGQPPYVAVTAFHSPSSTSSMTGAYTYSGLLPNMGHDVPERMWYHQRFVTFLANMWEEWLGNYDLLPKMDRMIREVDPTVPSAESFQQAASVVLLNSNAVIQYTEPMMPNVISVGGLQIIPSKPLPDDLGKVIESATGPVILFSLGTNMRSDMLGRHRLLEILAAMEQLSEYQFLWKFESDTLPRELPKNVFVRSWMPQNDLLAHPKLRLFITHSGLLSTQEAIWHGVLIIGFPVFADQYKNINYCLERGVGKRLDVASVNAKDLVAAVREVMTDDSYRKNMQRMSRLFRDQPEHPLERAIWWIEWVLRNPQQTELKSHGARLGLLQKYSFDVLIPLFAVFAFACHILVAIVRRLFFRSAKSKAQPNRGKGAKRE